MNKNVECSPQLKSVMQVNSSYQQKLALQVQGFGGYPQQAVAVIDYSPKVEMYIPPLLAPQKARML